MSQIHDQITKLEAKVNDLESDLGYLQRDYETQNEMIVVYSRELSNLQRTVNRLNELIETMSNSDTSNRKLEDEKPPHY